MLDVESKTMKQIAAYMSNPPLSKYLTEYIQTYIDPKYAHLDLTTDKGTYKLRQRNGLVKTLRRILATEINHKDTNDWALNEVIFNCQNPYQIGRPQARRDHC